MQHPTDDPNLGVATALHLAQSNLAAASKLLDEESPAYVVQELISAARRELARAQLIQNVCLSSH